MGSPAMEIKAYQKMQAQVRFIPDYANRIKELENQSYKLNEKKNNKVAYQSSLKFIPDN